MTKSVISYPQYHLIEKSWLQTFYSCLRLPCKPVQLIDCLFIKGAGMCGEKEVNVALSGKWWGSSGRAIG